MSQRTIKKPFINKLLQKIAVLALLAGILQLSACTFPSGVFEKDVAIPGQQWESSFRPRIDFTVSDQDTAFRYNVYLVLRHTDAYNYNNLWIRGTVVQPGDTSIRSERYDLTLATNEKGWLGNGMGNTGSRMDDIFEHRILLQPDTRFRKPGTYSFSIEQIMREDPLKHVLNVGIRVERMQ